MLRVWCLILLVLQAHLFACKRPRWPGGSYGILKPKTGCPRGFNGRGFFFQDTVDAKPSNNRSEILHIDGYVAKRDVLRYFCTNAGGTSSEDSLLVQWPSGQYCIYRDKDDTVEGMESGSILMYDEEDNNKDTFKIRHALFSIRTRWIEWSLSWTYDYTELYFSCQTSGNKKIPISLPINKPFYLLPYGSRDCQQVKWMVATSEWIKYHTRDKSDGNIEHGDVVPHVQLGNKNDGVTMYYCYYQSCKYTLTDKKGVFQSPGFPGKYPDGQLCSWRIMVPDNHTVRVVFTDFSLNGSNTDDFLRFFTKINGTYRINATFHGVKHPFNVRANAKVMFLFRSDKESNSYGFQAEYYVFSSRDHGTTTPRTITSESTAMIQSTMQASAKSPSSNPYKGVPKKSDSTTSYGRSRIITAILVPLAFATIGILLVIVILYRYRSNNEPKRDTSSGTREFIALDQQNNTTAAAANKSTYVETRTCLPPSCDTCDEYETPVDNFKEEKRSTSHDATVDNDAPEYHVLEPIRSSVPDNDGQVYQTLSRDQHPEYEALNYIKDALDPDIDPGTPEYHELEPLDNNDPDVVYHVLEGPDANDGPSDDHLYQVLDNETTHNPLYQSNSPVAMVTQNPLYV